MPVPIGDTMPVYFIDDLLKEFPLKAVLLGYLAIMSMITFCFYGHDKRAAKQKRRRIPEKRLFMLNLLGGFLGGWTGMYFFRHKTKHKSFYFVQFISALLWSCLIVFIFVYL